MMTMSSKYSTQFLLLFSQMVHEACIVEPSVKEFEPIVGRLNDHPIVNGTLSLDAKALYDLYLDMVEQNGISLEDIGQGVPGKRAPDFATTLCELYYFKRIDELKLSLKDNRELFDVQKSQLDAKSS